MNGEQNDFHELVILGGGPAGLGAGWFANQRNIGCRILEADDAAGGLCKTFEHDGFLFDSGAHRLHDKHRWVTRKIASLMAPQLNEVDKPSMIFENGRLLGFPLTAAGLAKHLGISGCAKAGIDLLKARVSKNHQADDFETFAIHKYGKTIAQRFLLNYSRKLWGIDCRLLSPAIAGSRLKGMDLRGTLLDLILRKKQSRRHVEGKFRYPDGGIGAFTSALAGGCKGQSLQLNSKVTKVFHNGRRITGAEVNNSRVFEGRDFISSIPLDSLASMMEPSIAGVDELVGEMRFRNVILVAFFLKTPRICDCATIYFPGVDFSFNRVYEPRNRFEGMSPQGCTSLVAEIACFEDEPAWKTDPQTLIDQVHRELKKTGWLNGGEAILSCEVKKLSHAYPVLTKPSVANAKQILAKLKQFENLYIIGRSGLYEYSWIHNILLQAMRAVRKIDHKYK